MIVNPFLSFFLYTEKLYAFPTHSITDGNVQPTHTNGRPATSPDDCVPPSRMGMDRATQNSVVVRGMSALTNTWSMHAPLSPTLRFGCRPCSRA